MKENVILFGGSFDPIHIGHAMVAQYVSQLHCGMGDELWLMPGKINPLKQGFPPASERHRAEMCRLVARKCSNMAVCELEFFMPTPSYTCDTLKELRCLYPDKEFTLLIGSDNWHCFDKWKNGSEILRNHRVLIYPRPGYSFYMDPLPEGVTLLKGVPEALISSTFIREALARGMKMNYFLPDEVLQYIQDHKLYNCL